MPLKTPVADDFFHCPPLTADQIHEFRAHGATAMRDLLAYTQLQGGPVEWTLLTNTNGPKVQMYTSKKDNVPIFLGKTKIESTLDEIRAIFTSPTTADVRELIAAYFPNLLDNVRLYNITDPLANIPHHAVTINWMLLCSPLRGVIVKHRDWCYVEHQQDVIIDGKNAWLRALKHVDIAACPDLEAKYGIIRGQILRAGFIYMETDRPGVLQVFEFHHNDPRGQLDMAMIGDFMVAKTAEIQCHSMNMMQTHIDSQRLSRLEYLPSHSLVAKHSRVKCAVCLRHFGTFSRKSNCRRCGEVVCGKICSALWTLIKSGIKIRVRICYQCSKKPAAIQPRSKSFLLKEDMLVSFASNGNFSGYTGNASDADTSYADSTPSMILLGSTATGLTLDGTLYDPVMTVRKNPEVTGHEDAKLPLGSKPEAPFGSFVFRQIHMKETS
ncbi:hypothetical protein AC1031_002775 [Aphanomyces cochlioides]|nr:hypothetical protein AC1031_002775 [Aphanomyces cochlioides]